MKRPAQLGGKPAAIARKMTLARLAKIRALIAEISCIWSDVDAGIEFECEEEIERVSQIETAWRSLWEEMDAEERSSGGAA
jgi:hypothetical protein